MTPKERTVVVVLELKTRVPVQALRSKKAWESRLAAAGMTGTIVAQASAQVAQPPATN